MGTELIPTGHSYSVFSLLCYFEPSLQMLYLGKHCDRHFILRECGHICRGSLVKCCKCTFSKDVCGICEVRDDREK